MIQKCKQERNIVCREIRFQACQSHCFGLDYDLISVLTAAATAWPFGDPREITCSIAWLDLNPTFDSAKTNDCIH